MRKYPALSRTALLCVVLLLALVTVTPSVDAQSDTRYYPLEAYSRRPPGVLATPVTLRGHETKPLRSLLHNVARQAGLSISFASDAVASQAVQVPRDLVNVPAASAILSLLRGTNLQAQISPDWQVVVLPTTPAMAEASDNARSQTVRGTVVDAFSKIPLYGANVIVKGTDPLRGSTTDSDGRFEIPGVPLGRFDIEARYLGYETAVKSAVVVGSAKEVVLTFELHEVVLTGEGVVVVPVAEKDRPVNEMAAVSARAFTVEETRRYAGGVDDPARMASAFAGVTTTGDIGDNALIIRGNAPKGVLWRLEGVEIPNPNHFAGLNVAGGGGVTIFSGQMLDDSDFLTGAFPAEYGNAVAGVFDMHLRSGNNTRHEHTLQLGLLGIDVASEGPISRATGSSYIFNYRYSTLGLLMPLLPINDLTTYQDLSFKLAFPAGRGGRLEFWGIGGLDRQRQQELENPDKWQYDQDRTRLRLALGMGASGITYRRVVGERSYLTFSAAATGNGTNFRDWEAAPDSSLVPVTRIRNRNARAIGAATLNHKFSANVQSRTGVAVHSIHYDVDVSATTRQGAPARPVSQGSGSSEIVRAFSHTRWDVGRTTLDVGLHTLYFRLSKDWSIEPRAALSLPLTSRVRLSAGYGLHSQVEDLRIYFVTGENSGPPLNRSLELAKAHHAVAGLDVSLSDVARVKLEGYYQQHVDVPVIPDSSYSLLNFAQDFAFDEALANEGAGRNYGVELTLERFMRDGYYFLVTGSAFRARYRGGDRIWRDGRYDRRFAVNLLLGREFTVQHGAAVIGINGRLTVNGGLRHSPVDEVLSVERGEVVYDERAPFTVQTAPQPVADMTATYRKNHRTFSSVWALQVKNVFASGWPYHDYNLVSARVESLKDRIVLPVLSYKIEF